MDAVDWELIQFVQLHGRLPGNGTLQAFDQYDPTDPLIYPEAMLESVTRRNEKYSRKAADRSKSIYTAKAVFQMEEVERRNAAAERDRQLREKARALQRIADKKIEADELERAQRAWRGELRRFALREERWRAEQHLWDDVEATTKEKRAEKLAKMKADIEAREEQAKLAKERRARQKLQWEMIPGRAQERWEANKGLEDAVRARKRKILVRIRDEIKRRCADADLGEDETQAILVKILTGAAETMDSVPYMQWDEINWDNW